MRSILVGSEEPEVAEIKRPSPFDPQRSTPNFAIDFARNRAQKQFHMSGSPAHFYADWRRLAARDRTDGALRDRNDTPPERLLQAVWQRQRLHRAALKTTDGRTVRVIHPGFASAGGGPDFRGAVLQIGDAPPCVGDVEIDLQPRNWRAHGHDRNPAFQNVLLHVVWQNTVAGPPPPAASPAPAVLPLQNVLDAPLPELSRSLETESLRALPEHLRGRCCAPLRELDGVRLAELLHSAARVRLENKAAQCRARARTAGWEQALWENLFRVLGYRHNAWPMQNVAETVVQAARPRVADFPQPTEKSAPLLAWQARLLGVSGLLPDELTRAQRSADGYLRRVWDFWWRERDLFADSLLPRKAWNFHGLRPANHPHRRLALAAHWLADEPFVAKIEKWIAGEPVSSAPDSARGEKWRRSLQEILQPPTDEFWSWHWTLRSARLKQPQPLLGAARATDLAVNAILPWLWMRAREGGSRQIQNEIERRYFAWPAAEDNAVLKLARQRLLGTARLAILSTAAAQQGLLQIVRDFCEHSNAACDQCRFPELVRDWREQAMQP